jgi:N utilization substance protein B
MANRQRERNVLLQALYEWDMRGHDNQAVLGYLEYTAEHFNDLEKKEYESLEEPLQEIVKKRAILDDIIEKAAPSWPLDKISVTDRNVLRLGLVELLFGDRDEVPPKVAINEAIELAKRYGGPKSGRFVNGVIGAVYREIGEPGKDEQGSPSMADVAYEDMPIEQKGSAVIYSIDDSGVIRIGMVHDVFGYWTLSKGGIAEGEDKEAGTIRKIKEETNWDVTIIAHLGENEYIAYPPEKGPTRKQVDYYLAKSEYTVPTLGNDSGGLNDVRWFKLDEIADLTMYEDVSQMIAQSIEIITNNTDEEAEEE